LEALAEDQGRETRVETEGAEEEEQE